MQRRTFLLASAAALPVMGANDRVNVAIVGVGGRGRAHVGFYGKLPNANIAAICDVDTAQSERAVQLALKTQSNKPKVYQDLRELYADKDVDAVSIATPNHWHALASIWAMQAGKDVYCEKPASYNIFEGQKMLETARKNKRILQIGMQSRSTPDRMRAIELLHQGAIGKLYMAKGLCFKRRPSIGRTPDAPVPDGVNWDIFLGPAPMRPFSQNRFRYNWHWFWDTGNGDIGNQGIHEMDIARWGLGRGLPNSVVSTGGKYLYEDDQETPNTQIATFDYGDAQIVFEVRGLITGGEANMPDSANFVGNIFLGSEGYMVLDHKGFQIYRGEKREPGESMKGETGDMTTLHMDNFLNAVKSRKHTDLAGDISEGATSAVLVHAANISYRLKRELKFDPAKEKFVGDKEADAMMTRPQYRAPYIVA